MSELLNIWESVDHIWELDAVEVKDFIRATRNHFPVVGVIVAQCNAERRVEMYWHSDGSAHDFSDREAEAPLLFSTAWRVMRRVWQWSSESSQSQQKIVPALWKHPDWYGQAPLRRYTRMKYRVAGHPRN